VSVLDVRWSLGGPPGREDYERGHVPGGAFVDLDEELAAPPGAAGRHPLPSAERFEHAMRVAGVSDAHGVVVYDAATSMAAARAWWLLRYFGHPDVRVLDGGFAAWTWSGSPVEAGGGTPTPSAGDFTAQPGEMPLLDAASAAKLASRGVLLDARAAERFRGETEPIDPVAGHIPGARNVPASELTQPSGEFRDAGALRETFVAAGVRDGVEIGTYCGSGVAAAQEVLALGLAGYCSALYVGSWSEWIADPSRAVATGLD
jgi:thiosulfate/3-mercaptopyruvate sulfurtransferase